MTASRKFSLVICLVYLASAIYVLGAKSLLMAAFLVFPLACIWYGEAMGSYSSPMRLTRATPGTFVVILGWILLLLPIIGFLIQLRKI